MKIDAKTTERKLEIVIVQGEPEQTKARLRILIAELRVNGKTDTQPTYRIVAPGFAQRQKKGESTVRCANPVVCWPRAELGVGRRLVAEDT